MRATPALVFLFIVGAGYWIESSFADVGADAIFATKGGAPPDSNIVSIGNPAHDVDFQIEVGGHDVLSATIHQFLRLKNDWHRCAGLYLPFPGLRNIGIFALIRSLHREAPASPENFAVGFQNVSSSTTDILNIK